MNAWHAKLNKYSEIKSEETALVVAEFRECMPFKICGVIPSVGLNKLLKKTVASWPLARTVQPQLDHRSPFRPTAAPERPRSHGRLW